MSEATTGLFNTAPVFPRLVLDETLKRARVETSEGVAVRVTSAAADLTPITDALGTQQDPAETPTVIGLLKNLIANGGGGGGGGASTTLQVPRIQTYDWLSYGGYSGQWQAPVQITFELNSEPITSFPDWADYIGFYSIHNGNLGVCKLKDNGSNKIIVLEIDARAVPDDPNAYTSLQLNKDYVKIELDEVVGTPTVPLTITFTGWNEDWAAGGSTVPVVRYFDTNDYADFIPFVFSLSSFDISGGGGGGGGGEAISTYSLTLNNTTVTNITAPIEEPASSDDQTLVSLGYLKDLINSAHLQRRQVLVTGQTTALTTGTTYNLESTFGITFPSWTNKIRIGFSFGSSSSQNYVEFGTAGQSGMAYSVFSAESGSVFYAANFSYIHNTRSFTINSIGKGNSSGYSTYSGDRKFNIISITAYGNFSF